MRRPIYATCTERLRTNIWVTRAPPTTFTSRDFPACCVTSMRRVVSIPRLLQSIAHRQFSRNPPTSRQFSRKPPNGWRRWRLHFMVTCSQQAWKISRPSNARSGGFELRASAISHARQGIPHSARAYPLRALLQSTPQQAPAQASRRNHHWAIDSIGHLASASASDRAYCRTARHPATGRRACCRATC